MSRKLNVISFLKENTSNIDKKIFDDFIDELEMQLIYVDKFEHTLYFDIYEFIYVFIYETDQYEIADELGISQSKVSKKLKKIDHYIDELLQDNKYKDLLKIITSASKTQHKSQLLSIPFWNCWS